MAVEKWESASAGNPNKIGILEHVCTGKGGKTGILESALETT